MSLVRAKAARGHVEAPMRSWNGPSRASRCENLQTSPFFLSGQADDHRLGCWIMLRTVKLFEMDLNAHPMALLRSGQE